MTNTNKNVFQDKLLSALREVQTPVSIYLMNGICLQGRINEFDTHVVLLENKGIIQAISKHAISTISPTRAVPVDGISTTEVTVQKRISLGLSGLSRPTY